VFNGEIYNFKELRTHLVSRGHAFRTDTDTEVIVHLYEEYGDECIGKLRGMFTFAIWDERSKKLLLARDRVGIKPLYYSFNSQRFIFASEIKALIADRSVRRDIDPEGIDRFLTFMYMPGEKTLFRDIVKLDAGHFLTVQNGKVSIRQYWDLQFEQPAKDINIEAATTELVNLLGETVRDHMISDVPVGVLLSGGVDSTALLSFVVEASEKEVETFTVGFDGRTFADERPYARLAAQTFGSRHHEMTISAKEFLDFLPKYVWHMEEPVCEPPAVALYYVSKLASNHVKVLLSGEGGDEAFAGYQNYRNLMWVERAKRYGWPVTGVLSTLFEHAGRLSGLEKFRKYSCFLRTPIEDYYYGRTWNPLSAFHGLRTQAYSESSEGTSKMVKALFERVNKDDILNRMLYVDSKT
ncbi:MAG TPA: asparagine synthase (glutamine-hydrolyzing), partial [Nitrospira sp.]|nr:asparagine synthase (glutamine-hydrolyzing) [Nitrospira sp.]